MLAGGPAVALGNSNKKPSKLPEKIGNIPGSTQVSGDYLSGSVWFNWASWICRLCQKKKSSSQPKRQRPPPTQVLKYTCNLYSEARLMPVKASAGFWPDNDAGKGGILLQRVCLCLPLRCFHWSDPAGRRSGWIPGFTSSCASQTVLTVAQFRQAKDLVTHQAHSFPLSSWKEFGNNKGWKGKRKIIEMVMQQILKTEQSAKTPKSNSTSNINE